MKARAAELDIDIECGGDWRSFKDYSYYRVGDWRTIKAMADRIPYSDPERHARLVDEYG
jgi:hypothetical protein